MVDKKSRLHFDVSITHSRSRKHTTHSGTDTSMGDSTSTTQTNGGAGFPSDLNAIYAKLAEVHRDPMGPWPQMLARVQAHNLAKGAVVLDLASGMGEPAATVARALPEVSVRVGVHG